MIIYHHNGLVKYHYYYYYFQNGKKQNVIQDKRFRSHQFYSSKAANPEGSDDLQVVEGPGRWEL